MHPDGWAVKKKGEYEPESIHDRQSDAERQAKDTVRDLGGGEVRIQGRDGAGAILTPCAPRNDPFPPRDTKG